MNILVKKKGGKLHMQVSVPPKDAREKHQAYTTQHVENWVREHKKDIDLNKYELIAQPRLVHDGLGDLYLSGEWVYALKEEPKKKVAAAPPAPKATTKATITSKKTKKSTKNN